MARCIHGRKLRLGCDQCSGKFHDGRLVVCVPMRSTMSAETALTLERNMDGVPYELLQVTGMQVEDARNELARQAVASGAEFTLWLDDDAFFEHGTLARLIGILRQRPEIDMLTPMHSDRKAFCATAAFRVSNGVPQNVFAFGTTHKGHTPPSHLLYMHGEVASIDSCAFHCVLMRTALLKRVGSAPFTVPAGSLYGEDVVFGERVKRTGGRIALDSLSVAAHVDIDSGLAFIPCQRPGRIEGNRFVVVPDPRSDAEISAEWQRYDCRANRKYGARVDNALRDARTLWERRNMAVAP